ncbi:MAG: hypothetical protein RL141_656 [Candidatus Parcubacteria bacterium]|jgi:glycosyltransferase involved in cell wall biosynthesis
MRVSCSVPILTLNVRPFLERLLPVLLASFDDVYVVDGNSTDGTVEFAQSLGVRVERQSDSTTPNKRITDFTAARLHSWSFARHDWIFLVDADEMPSEDLLLRVAEIVRADRRAAAHRFRRLAALPNGRVIQHAFFYPEDTMVRLFCRSSGVTLTQDRRVHERFVLPAGIAEVRHTEAFIHQLEPPALFAEKMRRYAVLEAREDAPHTIASVWRWMVWYNLRSGLGQSMRAVRASLRGMMRNETVLPWGYTLPMLAYRFYLAGQGMRMLGGGGLEEERIF